MRWYFIVFFICLSLIINDWASFHMPIGVLTIFHLIIMLRIWKFWNTNELLVLWESWILRRKHCRNYREHFWSHAKHREKKYQRAQLELGEKKRTNFQNTTSLTNTFLRETFHLPHYFSSLFPPTIELQISACGNFPMKIIQKIFSVLKLHNQICRFLTSSMRHLSPIPGFLWVESYKGYCLFLQKPR